MKKITLLCCVFVVCAFTWQLNAQSVATQLFSANGTDTSNFQLSINASDITVNEGQPLQSVTVLNYEAHYNTATGTQPCPAGYSWFYFNLDVTGGISDGVSVVNGCEPDYIGFNLTDFTNATFTSVDSATDNASDTVYLFVTLQVTYQTAACPAPATLASANITTTSADLSWTESGSAASWEVELVNVSAGGTPTGTPTTTGVTSPYSPADLTPANNYAFYVRADCGGSTSAWAGPLNFSTMALPPDNTTCADATLIGCGQTLNGTTVGSTGTSEDSGCAMGSKGVWYTFKGTGGDITVSSTATFDHKMAIARGACGTLTNIICKDGSTGAETHTIPLTTLNQDYYVYIAHYSSTSTTTGTYSITLTCATPPACTQAVVGSSNIVSDCDASQFSVNVDVTSVANAVEISNGTTTWPITAPGVVTVGPFAFGQAQTLTVIHTDAACNLALGSFNSLGCPPANDNCSSATALTVEANLSCSNPVAGTTVGATQSLPGCAGTANDDVWYSFVATGTAHTIIINNTGGNSDIVTQVFDGCGGASLTCQDTPNSPIVLTGLTPSNTYYFRIYTYSSTLTITTNFTVCVGTPPAPPANDACSGAYEVSSLPYNYSQTDGGGATNNDGYILSCNPTSAGGMNDGLWFTFTPVTDGIVDIAVTNVAGWDAQLDLYSGSCGTFTCVTNRDIGLSSGNETITGQAVTAGTQYFINVGHYSTTSNSSEGNFDISVTGTFTLGLNEVESLNAFSYFPNPVKNTLNLKAQSSIQNVAIYNMLGQEVLRTSPNTLNSEIDMSTLQTGAYFVKVTINDSTETVRVIKQ